jgi:putative tryptophan/tyrosine transport system substrate-binding protein
MILPAERGANMRRRDFLGILSGAMAAWPIMASAQQAGNVPRIGMVYPGPDAAAPPRVESLLTGLRSAGYLAPAQIELVLRVTNGDPARIAPMVAEIIASNVDVLFAVGPAVLRTARAATQTIPIVAIDLESDPVDNGTVASLAHPGGNVTGLFLAFPDFTTKWLQMLKETVPGLSVVAVLWDPTTGTMQKKAVEGAAELLGVTPVIVEVQSPADFDAAFSSASQRGAGALIMLSSPIFSATGAVGPKLAELSLFHKLPAVSLFPDFARAGGLLAYGPNLLDIFRQGGVIVAKVLQGSKPGDLPIERPSKFELVVNSRTAKALHVVFPMSLLVRADEVIE